MIDGWKSIITPAVVKTVIAPRTTTTMSAQGQGHHTATRTQQRTITSCSMKNEMKWNDWCFRPRFFTVRLYWAGDNLGEWDGFCYKSCPWRRTDRLTCWPVVQHATTVPRMPPLISTISQYQIHINCKHYDRPRPTTAVHNILYSDSSWPFYYLKHCVAAKHDLMAGSSPTTDPEIVSLMDTKLQQLTKSRGHLTDRSQTLKTLKLTSSLQQDKSADNSVPFMLNSHHHSCIFDRLNVVL